jgi:molybdopterin/thiamine biosynthesis adenylyltransferase
VSALASARVLVVGAGGLGCPVLVALAHAGVGTIGIADDDEVAASNLHRQILFSDADVGKDKVEIAAREIAARAPALRVNMHHTRILPNNAQEIVRGYDMVIEGSDNFPTKFLVADACALEQRPVVHGAAIRWHGTAFFSTPAPFGTGQGGACYRCVFEDIPSGAQASCDTAGVMGPVVGVVGALMADLALRALEGREAPAPGTLVSFDGKTDALRRRVMARRADCALCGDAKVITGIDRGRYAATAAL